MKNLLLPSMLFGLTFALFGNVSNAGATEDILTVAMDNVAKNVDSVLTNLGREKQVVIGSFKGAAGLKTSGGIELSRQLANSLEKIGVHVSDSGSKFTEITGRFKLTEAKQESDEFESTALDITIAFFDEAGDELLIKEIKGSSTNKIGIPIFGDQALQIAGVTLDVSPKLPEKERQEEIASQIKNPPTTLKGNQVRAKGPFGLEVLVNNDGRVSSREPTLDGERFAFVPLHEGEEYIVKIHNDAEFEIAISLLIDGVNMFVDAKDAKPAEQILVGAGKAVQIPGWYIHSGQSEIMGPDNKPLAPTKAFLISGFDSSVAKRVGSDNNVGTISVEIRAAWDPESSPPTEEPQGDAKGVATSQGRDIDQKYKRIPRKISTHVRTILNVRYSR